MNENLIGYALNLHDDETRRRLDAELRSPEAQQRLEQVRQALAPLGIDRDAVRQPVYPFSTGTLTEFPHSVQLPS